MVPLLAQTTRATTSPLTHALSPQIVLLEPPRTKSSPAPPSTRRARSPPSRGTHTCARDPPSFSNARPACRCSTSGPSCRRRTPLRRDRDGLRVLLICVVLLGAACLFYFFTELVMAASLPVLFLALGAAVACAAAAAFLAQGQAKLGGADGALREDHLAFTIASSDGQPCPTLAPEQASGHKDTSKFEAFGSGCLRLSLRARAWAARRPEIQARMPRRL